MSDKIDLEITESFHVWCGEEGDEWYAMGHVDPEKMREGVAEDVKQLGNPEDLPKLEDLEITHYWVLQCEFNEEAFHIVAEGTPRAEPITRAG